MSQLFVFTMLPFWLQATAKPPAEAEIAGLAQGSLSLFKRNSSPRGLPSGPNRRPYTSAVYRGAESVTTIPLWFIGAVVMRSLTQANAKPPSGKAVAEADR